MERTKTRTYTLTHYEVMALREALREEKFRIRDLPPANSPAFAAQRDAVEDLFEMFSADIFCGRI